ncbi:chaperone TorD involved in molybdoenzyme TorA maturation [Pasteurella testudinis DSM 23072]|uniref:Probable Tat proofreading chaperone DmsD n=1 Tax=Pasteurella testudinis DSM 23072 TaxID=1122938 RepID=A0A1W1UGJ0_9PAST|nr:Tat proofreading chaperone DmsD [Pasteurella testudinis]SMB80215.1 chaperone TorD involved in molybdoenzyme TorA maturation [Pasteurella testudinis DSM 23072]SUB50569.1 DMSO/Nitrate reductase chaperone family protein [Pasteurella testudinis]
MDSIQTSISQFGRILGSLFYTAPEQAQNRPLLELFRQDEWQAGCDFLTAAQREQIQHCLTQGIAQGQAQLSEDFQALFIGPNALPAPPWGSVYLDKEAVIFGSSLLELRDFMQRHGISLSLAQNEPEDHFGLMLMMAAWLAENQPQQLGEFLQQHLLPWSGRFLELLTAEQHRTFYCGLGLLSQALLADWQQRLRLDVPKVRLYR